MKENFLISEDEKSRILNQHKTATKNHYLISESITGKDMSSIDRMKKKYPNGFQIPYTITSSGGSTFANGIDTINKSDPKIQEILTTISDLLKATKGNVNVIVNGGASNTSWGNNAAGSPEAIKKNKELAARRRENLLKLIRGNWASNRLIVTPGSAVVGNAKEKDSPAARKEQFVSAIISGEKSQNIPIQGVQGDNTNIYIPDINRNINLDVIPKKGKMKRVCIQIPEKYVEKFRLKVREFKNENSLGDIPWGVYDVKK
jgi:hypothetical protein